MALLMEGHGETDALENMGRVPEGVLRECAMFSTLSPCYMVSEVIPSMSYVNS